MKNKSVITYAGGGGSRSTGKTRALDPNVILNSERSERDSGSDQCDRKNELSSRGANERERRGDPISQCSILKWIATPAKPARNDAGGRAGLLLGWSLKSHVQPLWMALSAFTMAEILLSLTIIGVVAAITLPSLTGNINERTWNTQRKALYARFSQAVALMPALNGYGTVTDGDSSTSAVDTAAETFITSGLSKVLKINNICDNDHLEDCGLVSQIITLNGSKIDLPQNVQELNPLMNHVAWGSESYNAKDTKAAAFETANGESIIVYYRPTCTSNVESVSDDIPLQKFVCANFIYDLNGTKGPNTVGKDIGVMTALYSNDSALVAPYPYPHDTANSVDRTSIASICKNQDPQYRLPSRDELVSIFVNKKIFGNLDNARYWSSSLSTSAKSGWYLHASSGYLSHYYDNASLAVRCVKRD